MRTSARLSVVVGLAGLALSGAMAVAHAQDVGDGSLTCVRGEICFGKNDSGTNFGGLKHYYNSDSNHSDNTWNNGGGVKDAATVILPRDTDCTIRVTDGATVFEGAEIYDFPRRDTATNYAYMGDDANDENDGHIRINETAGDGCF